MSTAKTALPSTGSMLLKNVRLTFAQGLFEASTIPGQATGKPKLTAACCSALTIRNWRRSPPR